MSNPIKILIVDDDETSNLITSMMLERNIGNTEIHISENGKEAIDYLCNLEDSFPTVIFLDINMPLVNGFEFLTWFGRNCSQEDTMITIFSTSNRKEDREKALKFDNVIDYIEKPLNRPRITVLLNKVNQMRAKRKEDEIRMVG